MAKLNRKIDNVSIENSKRRTMNFVMNEINEVKVPWYHSLFNVKNGLLLATSIAFLLILGFTMLNGPDNTPTIYALNEENSSTVAEMSYMASHLVAVEFDLNISEETSGLVFLNTTSTFDDETEFESDLEDFSTYFNMLKFYFDESTFEDSIVFTLIEDGEFEVEILFTIDNISYRLLVNQTSETQFEGILEFDGVAFDVNGTITNEDDETKFNFEARNGEDVVTIDYKDETSIDESKKSYKISSTTNSISTEKEVTVKVEDDEMKVEVIENQNQYQLKHEFEDGQWRYKLEYKINENEGEVIITEEEINGETSYNYHVREGSVEKDIQVGPPSFVDKDPNSNRSQNSDNDGDGDDTPGNGENGENNKSDNSNGNNGNSQSKSNDNNQNKL